MPMQRFANPLRFKRLSGALLPWTSTATLALFAAGLWLGLAASPRDYQQGETVRIMYIHVPAAWLSMFCYATMTASALGTLVWRHPLADAAQKAAAPIGASFTFICLVTGSLWGKPMWGTWWVWDARLTSELILFFLYLGYIALTSAIDDVRRADRAGALIAIVGAINVPIIYFSVKWWNTLHQGASVSLTRSPSMAQLMLWGMLLMALSFWVYTLAIVTYRVRSLILERERHTAWVQALPEVSGAKK
jgi:heme exporter protein C